jgi:FkbM family methyltransferase
MLKNLLKKGSRITLKSTWISSVSPLGVTLAARLFLVVYGYLALIIDPIRWKLKQPVKLNYHNQTFPFIIHGLTDFGLMHEILVSDAYQLKNHASQSVKTVIDLGSNSGVSSLYLRALFPNAQIHSIEPNPQIFTQLNRNANEIGHITAHQVLLSDYTGVIDFHYDKKSSVSSSLVKRGTQSVAINLPCITLSQMIKNIGCSTIDILKFDVEGSEERIFRHFNQFDQIDTIIGELHYDLCDAGLVHKIISDNYPNVKLQWFSLQRAYIMASKNNVFKLISDQNDC